MPTVPPPQPDPTGRTRRTRRAGSTNGRLRSGWEDALLRALGLLLLLSAIALALSRAPDRPVESLVARWAPPPSDFLDLRGQLVHLRDEGPRHDPVPIVLLHGTAASLHTWEPWVHELRRQRRVVSVDLPGFGLTGPFGGEYAADDYRGDHYARFVLDLLDHLQIRRAVLIGHSLGGEIAWRTAVLDPQRIERLVLVAAAGPAFTPAEVPPGFLLARLPVAGLIAQWFLPRAVVSQTLASVYADPSRISSELVDRYFELTLREGNRRALRLMLQQVRIGADAGRIATLEQPTLILWGAADRFIPPSVGTAFEQAIAGSRLVVLDGLGHVPQEEDPSRSLAPVLDFLGLR